MGIIKLVGKIFIGASRSPIPMLLGAGAAVLDLIVMDRCIKAAKIGIINDVKKELDTSKTQDTPTPGDVIVNAYVGAMDAVIINKLDGIHNAREQYKALSPEDKNAVKLAMVSFACRMVHGSLRIARSIDNNNKITSLKGEIEAARKAGRDLHDNAIHVMNSIEQDLKWLSRDPKGENMSFKAAPTEEEPWKPIRVLEETIYERLLGGVRNFEVYHDGEAFN